MLTTALDIERWADRIAARPDLPLLVRRLILATADDLVAIDFPAGDSIGRPGFDGETLTTQTGVSPWIPAGRTVWEMGTSKGVASKANSDFSKRTAATAPEVQRRTNYIFVTPRFWTDKHDWASERSAEHAWNTVRAYDRDDLEQWLDTAAAVDAWFASRIGLTMNGCDCPHQYWQSIAHSTRPALSPGVFLSGRERATRRVEEWLRCPGGVLRIESRSPREVVPFVAAFLQTPGWEQEAARSIVVESWEAWRTLRDRDRPLNLLLLPSVQLRTEELTRTTSAGHRVLVPHIPDLSAPVDREALPRPSAGTLSHSLRVCGFPEDVAHQAGHACGGSLSILLDRLAEHPGRQAPDWLSTVDRHVVRATLLLGGWNESVPGDCDVFQQVAGRPYPECRDALRILADSPDPLLLRVGSRWRVLSKDHAWTLCGRLVHAAEFESLETVAVRVLTEDIPELDLPPDERVVASLRPGNERNFSSELRLHLADTLALLGTLSADSSRTRLAPLPADLGSRLAGIVRAVLAPAADWRRYSSLGPCLTKLAEAAPQTFLGVLDEHLTQDPGEFRRLLRDEEEPLVGRRHHCGLLWALETLAWSRSFLVQSCDLLLRLHAIDSPGRSSNRPRNSLTTILCHRLPHTLASLDERRFVVDRLLEADPDHAWSVVAQLLPDRRQGIVMPSARPYWRDWSDGWGARPSHAERRQFAMHISARLMQTLDADPDRWLFVADALNRFAPHDRARLPGLLSGLAARDNLDDADRAEIYHAFEQELDRHRRFSDAGWSLPAAEVAEIRSALVDLAPDSPALRYASLFERWSERYFDGGDDPDVREQLLTEARQAAVREILDAEGLEALLDMAGKVYAAGQIGVALAEVAADEYAETLLAGLIPGGGPRSRVVHGFVNCLHQQGGLDCARGLLPLCPSDAARGVLLAMLPFSRELVGIVDDAADEAREAFWCGCFVWGRDAEDILPRVCREFLARGRAVDAVDLLSMQLHIGGEVDPELLASSLEGLLSGAANQQRALRRDDSHAIRECFTSLQEAGGGRSSPARPTRMGVSPAVCVG